MVEFKASLSYRVKHCLKKLMISFSHIELTQHVHEPKFHSQLCQKRGGGGEEERWREEEKEKE